MCVSTPITISFREGCYFELKNLSLINNNYYLKFRYNFESERGINKFVANFCSFNIQLKKRYYQFEQKCVRKVIIERRFAVNLLIDKIKNKNKLFMSLYCNPVLQNTLFNRSHLEIASGIVQDYSTIITELLIIHFKKLLFCTLNKERSRITQTNLPVDIERLQNVFVESIVVAVYAISILLTSLDGQIAGSDSVRFRSFRDFLERKLVVQFIKGKFIRLFNKKELQGDSVIKIAQKKAIKYNYFLCLLLLQKVNFKSLRKNYKSNSIKRI